MLLFAYHLQTISGPRKYSKKDSHLQLVDCAYEFTKTWLNPTGIIDSHSINRNAKNFRFNFEVFH